METAIYITSALISLACSVLLLRGYKESGARLLLWSGLCFVGFTLNNILQYVDVVIYPEFDLFMWRNIPNLVGLMFLLYGMILDTE